MSDHTPTGRGQQLLRFIESHTTRMHEESRKALNLLLGGALSGTTSEGGQISEPTIESLERYAPSWSELVPDEMSRISLAHLLAQKYDFGFAEIPRIRQALHLEEASTQRSYEAAYGRPLSEIYTHRALTVDGKQQSTEKQLSDDDAALHAIMDELTWVSLRKGDTLMREGDAADAMYIVTSGRLRVVVQDESGQNVAISEVRHGESVGEMALVTGEPRSATVYAVRDSQLQRLSRAGFDRLVERHPQMLMTIIRTLATRVRRSSSAQLYGRTVTTIAVLPTAPRAPIETLAEQLAESLRSFGPTLLVNHQTIERLQTEGRIPQGEADANDARLVTWLNDQESRYRYVVYAADPSPSPWTRRCLRQADRLLILALAGSEPARDIASVLTDEHSDIERDLILLHPDGARHPVGTQQWLTAYGATRHQHVRLGREGDIQRLARSLVGRSVGLVLSGGGARCLAHIGAIRAIQEAGIPVDWVGGSSIGAVVAGQYAMGWDWDTILQRSKALVEERRGVLDYTLPFVSILAANRLARGFYDLFGEVRIEDLWLGYFCTSSSLASASLVIHRDGLLRRAIRASCALPGILPPLFERGELLVDGGILDNLPVDAMKELCNGGPVIAVDVSMEFALAKDYSFGEGISAGQLLFNRLNPFAKSRLVVPNIIMTLLRTAELQAVRSRSMQRARADVYIQPPVAHFGIFDTKSVDRMVELGYQHAAEQIAAWVPTAGSAWAS